MMMITFILRYSPLLDMWFLSMHSHVILSTWVTNFFIEHFWISTKVVKLQRWHGWCHMKLLPSQCILCTPYNHAPCCLMQSHIRKVYACLAATCHLHFWQNDWDLLRATAVTRGWNRYQKKESTQKVDPGEEIFPTAPAGIWTCNLSITRFCTDFHTVLTPLSTCGVFMRVFKSDFSAAHQGLFYCYSFML